MKQSHFSLIASGIDVAKLRTQLGQNPQLWNVHSSRKESDGTPHGEMSDIWVRYRKYDDLKQLGRERFNEIHVPTWYPAWHVLTTLKPIIFGLMSQVSGEILGGVLITKIPPGSRIEPHVDSGWHVETYKKLYLSVESEKMSRFYCDHGGHQEFIEPEPGQCFLFDNRKRHWVINDSGKDRITLIVCIRSEKLGYD